MRRKGPIVVVEDDVSLQFIIGKVIKDLGLNNSCKTFINAERALEYLRECEQVPFIILCDLNLPGIDGLTFKKILNSDPEIDSHKIPFIFFSATAYKLQLETAFVELSVQGYFVKGTNLTEVQNTLAIIFNYWKASHFPVLSLN